MEVVPYYLDVRMRPHAITVEQLQTHSAADLDYCLAGGSMAVGSLAVRALHQHASLTYQYWAVLLGVW